jgi:hypothetical protein
MLRVVSPILLILLSSAPVALANPQLGDDLANCRDRKLDMPTRLAACENLLGSDRATGKDKSNALTVRGFSLLNKRDFDHALEAFAAARNADPDNIVALNGQAQAPTSARVRTISRWPPITSRCRSGPTMAAPIMTAARSICARARCRVRSTT